MAGAIYRPEPETVPALADHVIAVLLLPLTVAVNCCAAPVTMLTEVGVRLTETTGADTTTVALADLVASAALVVVIV